jgi:hypothetical protein
MDHPHKSNPRDERRNQFVGRLKVLGIKTEECTQYFYLEDGKRYRPDYYLPALNTYVELLTTKQAYEDKRELLDEVIHTCALNLWVVSYDLQTFHPENFVLLKGRHCSIPDCEGRVSRYSPINSSPYCLHHLRMLEKYGVITRQGIGTRYCRSAAPGKCSAESCDQEEFANNLCYVHLFQKHPRHRSLVKVDSPPAVEDQKPIAVKVKYPEQFCRISYCGKSVCKDGFCDVHHKKMASGRFTLVNGRFVHK